ncbi:MAG: tetratricopeptide repeat protein [Halioglobus sp.]
MRERMQWTLLSICCLLSTQWVVAGTPEPYGQDFYRLDASWEDGRARSLPNAEAVSRPVDAGAYLQQLERQEVEGGPYADGLAEPLVGLGRYYRDQGNYPAALHSYQRALHVVRVNDGLYSERQIPLVRDLLDTYRLSGEMEALDERYEYFFRLYGSGQPPFTDLRLRATVEFLRWQREATRLDLDGSSTVRLIQMYELNNRILEDVAQSVDVKESWYQQLALSQIRNLYLLQTRIRMPNENVSLSSGPLSQSGQGMAPDFNEQRLVTIMRTSSARGRALLQEVISRASVGASPAELAALHLELGDWHQWNDSTREALKEYRRAIQILEDAGETLLLERWLGSPVELPANGAFWQPKIETGEVGRVVLLADYDVSTRGNARNIRISSLDSGGEAYTGRLRRKLAATRFRPRIAAGEAVFSEGLSRKYETLVE